MRISSMQRLALASRQIIQCFLMPDKYGTTFSTALLRHRRLLKGDRSGTRLRAQNGATFLAAHQQGGLLLAERTTVVPRRVYALRQYRKEQMRNLPMADGCITHAHGSFFCQQRQLILIGQDSPIVYSTSASQLFRADFSTAAASLTRFCKGGKTFWTSALHVSEYRALLHFLSTLSLREQLFFLSGLNLNTPQFLQYVIYELLCTRFLF